MCCEGLVWRKNRRAFMKFRFVFGAIMLAGGLSLAACSESPEGAMDDARAPSLASSGEQAGSIKPSRWYSEQQVRKGRTLFQQYCAECHKFDASGDANWRQPAADGKYPPPPLNGSAHTWHHHLDGLRRTVRLGGVPMGGSMPGFGDKLNSREIDAVLAWVQSRWSAETYAAWQSIDARARK
jgi:mono/diheme cytochrome c family protein